MPSEDSSEISGTHATEEGVEHTLTTSSSWTSTMRHQARIVDGRVRVERILIRSDKDDGDPRHLLTVDPQGAVILGEALIRAGRKLIATEASRSNPGASAPS